MELQQKAGKLESRFSQGYSGKRHPDISREFCSFTHRYHTDLAARDKQVHR